MIMIPAAQAIFAPPLTALQGFAPVFVPIWEQRF